ncbi:RNA-directed DNA polymerase, eukaryota, reverse transcriptase zinc-binding domain protein [Tanacetum coccineum]
MRINKHQVPDGFSSKNFKKAWHVVGDDVCMAIKEFFHNWKLLGEVDATLISLVPKIETPTKVSDFRPIACCNVIYKCISKILTNMIKNSLCKVVSPNQSAFILGRQITDNILISQELLRGYNWNNGAKRVSFKIDIQKAYDTMNWDFLEKTLVLFGKRLKENPEIQILVHWGSKQLKFSQFKLCLMPFNEVNQGYVESVNVVKLKGNSIWDVKVESNSSSRWKQMLMLRDKMRSCWEIDCKRINTGSIIVKSGSNSFEFSNTELILAVQVKSASTRVVLVDDDEASNHEDALDTGNAPKQQQQAMESSITWTLTMKYGSFEEEKEWLRKYLADAIPKEHMRRFYGRMLHKRLGSHQTRFGGIAKFKEKHKAVFKQQF